MRNPLANGHVNFGDEDTVSMPRGLTTQADAEFCPQPWGRMMGDEEGEIDIDETDAY